MVSYRDILQLNELVLVILLKNSISQKSWLLQIFILYPSFFQEAHSTLKGSMSRAQFLVLIHVPAGVKPLALQPVKPRASCAGA